MAEDLLARATRTLARLTRTPGPLEAQLDALERRLDGDTASLPEPYARQIDEVLEGLYAIARLELGNKVPELGVDERLDALAAGVNMLGEELQSSTVSRDYLDGVIHAMGDALFVVDASAAITDLNAQASALTGLPRASLLELRLVDLVPSLVWDDVRDAAVSGPVVEEHTILAPESKTARISITPLSDDRFVVLSVDVTAHRELADTLEAARDEAMAISRQRSQFLANMSHEIRTPINGVIGMTGLMLASDLTPDQRDMAETIDVSAKALLDVVNDVLDFSRIDAGRLQLETVEFDVREIVEDVMSIHSVAAAQKGIELISSLSAEVSRLLIGDPGRIRQILTNLVSNAVKFTATGEVRLVVNQPLASGPILFRVHDTGIGIPKERIEALFDPFVQADESTTRQYGGSGLGLAICRELAQAMGGELRCESVVDQGSTFTLAVPLGVSHATAADEPDLDGVRVLVVDDNETNRNVQARQLRTWGAIPTTAASAMEAYGLLREANAEQARIPIVLIDLNMPGRDGLSLARDITNDRNIVTPLMILLTSLDAVPSQETLHAVGIRQVIHKPIRARIMRRAIGSLLAGRGVDSVPRHHPVRTFPGARVLVAEDNPINQKVILGYLTRLKTESACVSDGRAAVDRIMEEPGWDLVLMDVRMPVMDGYEATALVRERGAQVPIVALTADVVGEARQRCLRAGMNGFLAKPVIEHNLVSAMTHWLGEGVLEDPPPLREPIFDPSVATELVVPGPTTRLQRLADATQNPRLVPDLIEQLAERAPLQLTKMRDAIESNDWDTITLVAHSLRGSALTLGAVRIATVAEAIERAGAADARLLEGRIASIEKMLAPTLVRLHELTLGGTTL